MEQQHLSATEDLQKATGAAGGAVSRRRNGKVFLELNRDFNGEDYECEDEAKLVIFPAHHEIPLPNIEELPALVTIACDAVLNATSPYKKVEVLSWEDEIQCRRCEMRENLWLNLTDGAVHCGKWFCDGTGGNGHAVEHYREYGFPLASQNGPRDSEIRQRAREWEMTQESGHKLKAVYGAGYTGIKNLGNSCYLGTTMQVLFSIPEFQRTYVGNLQRIFDHSPLNPSQDFGTQMAKLGHALLSGQYSRPPVKSELIEQVMKEERRVLDVPQQRGVSPRMFKALVGKDHPEFSSTRQQDALEFFLHLMQLVERDNSGPENPSGIFRFLMEERIQCCQSRKELLAYEAARREAEENMAAPPAPVWARIPFTACLQAFTEPENVPDFWSSALQAKSAGVKTCRFASFPDYMVVQIKKFTFGTDWIPKKIDVSVDMPDFLDLSRLRATGLQAGEMELPDLSPPVVIPENNRGSSMNFLDSSDIDESSVLQLAEMGFPMEACRKAVYYTGNFAEPLAMDSFAGVSPAFPTLPSFMESQPPEESVAILTSMGFPRQQSIRALRSTNNNLERALDWIFTHSDSEENSDAASDIADTEPDDEAIAGANGQTDSGLPQNQQERLSPTVRDGPGRYELLAFISHMGTSTKSGHYVCHIKKEGRWIIYNDHKVCLSEKPPKDWGYLYFYHRLSSS
ncbi:hypothetical protein JZ751_008172 [Albula glossodonta]|uniref:ubiquitinyl hydrolase 1 n=1 Tax=Albula glossodonta TaxID=121402 RepID=A0A8T2MXD8_9TELE|nr:hypothetical protein JZ751_008172 [Albula glossodonta]